MEHVTEQQLTRRQSTVWRALRAAAPQTIPVLAGYFVLGMGYGIYVQSLGLPVWMPMLMGTVVYGGTLCYVLLVQLVFRRKKKARCRAGRFLYDSAFVHGTIR